MIHKSLHTQTKQVKKSVKKKEEQKKKKIYLQLQLYNLSVSEG
jgi:hypothetical protein